MLLNILQNAWDWIEANMTTLKDLLWIVFTFIATLVAFLTYRRARFTLLQPLRTEVIKRQTDLLVELLDYLHDDGIHFSFKLDYMGIVACNSYLLMKEYGFILKDDEISKTVEKNISGLLILKESGPISSIELPSIFENEKSKTKKEEVYARSEKKYKLAKQGVVELESIHMTKQFSECSQKLAQFINNPFMPSAIQKLLKELMEEINYNLKVAMRSTLEEFVVLLCDKSDDANEENPISIQHRAIYNNFQRRSKHHNAKIDKIRETTRMYLMVDKKWH